MDGMIQSHNPCYLTGKRDALVVGTLDRDGKPLRTVISTTSGLVFTDPAPTSDELRQFYAQDYRVQYKGTTRPKPKHVLRAGRLALRRLQWLTPHLPENARVLDIGSGGGEFVFLARQAGLQAQGVEPNEGYADYSQASLGIPVQTCFFQDLDSTVQELDGITLFHVLEHLPDPLGSLRWLATRLRPGGTLAIEVPDVDYTGIAPQNRFHIGHLYNFNAMTLAATGQMAGLQMVETKCDRRTGVLQTVFRRPEPNERLPEPNEDALVQGFHRTWEILRRHTVLTHYTRPEPVFRFCRKLWQYTGEQCYLGWQGAPPSDALLGKLRPVRPSVAVF